MANNDVGTGDVFARAGDFARVWTRARAIARVSKHGLLPLYSASTKSHRYKCKKRGQGAAGPPQMGQKSVSLGQIFLENSRKFGQFFCLLSSSI